MTIKSLLHFLLLTLFSGVIGAFITLTVIRSEENKPESRIANFYKDEMATVVSPQTVKKYIDEKNTDYILVDLRSQGEYKNSHAITAINIPAGSMNETELVAAFQKLDTSKEIIVHCYSSYCTLSKQVGEALAQHGIFVKEMSIGWSEWRFHWDLWNPGADKEDGEAYVVSDKSDLINTPISPVNNCSVGEFGC